MYRSALLLSAIFGGVNIALVQTVSQAKTKIEIGRIAQSITVQIESIDTADKGSGILIAKNDGGYILLTAAHVIKTATHPPKKDSGYKIRTPDGKVYQSDAIVKADNNLDLALVTFRSKQSYQLAKIGTSKLLERGSEVYVAGFPASTTTVVDGSFQSTAGTVTGIASIPDNSGYSLIYDSITQPGMSGGPVLNEEGQLVAIHGRGAHDTLNSQKNGFNLGIVIEKIWTNSGLDGLKRSLLIAVDEKRKKGDYQEALQDYNQLIAFNPQFSEAYCDRATLKSDNLRDFYGALSDFSKCIEIDSQNSFAYAHRGHLKAIYLNDVSGGITDLDKAIKINTKYEWAFSIRGWIKEYKTNDWLGALLDYNKLILINPNPSYYYDRGLLRKDKIKDKLGAIQDFRQAVRLYSAANLIKEVQNSLNQLRELGVTE